MRWFAGRARRRADDVARDQDPTTGHRRYSISCDLGGFGVIGIPWTGASLEDARDTFLDYTVDHARFHDFDDPLLWSYRSMYVNFHGQVRLLTFKTDWIAGFTVH